MTRGTTTPWGSRVLLALTLVVLSVTLVIHVAPWVTKGFGYSYDGYNGAMWGLGARGAVEDPIGNRLGGIQPSGYRYANHPPLLVWTTAVTSGATDERPVALRAPALLASLAALVVLAALLRDAGFGLGTIAGGLAVAGTSGMFLTFGAMLDTPILSLPFGLAAVWAAQRAWQGRPPPPMVGAAAGGLAALAGWQSLLAAALATLLVLRSPTPEGRRAGRALAVGTAAGLALTLAWVAWVKGTLLALGDQARYRTGAGTGTWLEHLRTFAGDLWGPVLPVLAVLGLGLALALQRQPERSSIASDDDAERPAAGEAWGTVRPLAAVLGTVVVLYTVAFRQASAAHSYWTFWGVAVVAVATTAVLHAVTHLAGRLPRAGAMAVQAAAATGVVALALTGAARRSHDDRRIRDGLRALPVLAAAPQAAHPDTSSIVARDVEPILPWADFALHGRTRSATPAELDRLPADTLVFLVAGGDPGPAVRAAAVAVEGPYVLMRAGDYQRLVG